VRLHPVTQLLLFAVVLRLVTDDVMLIRISELLAYPGFGPAFTAIKVRAVSAQMAELAQTVMYLGTAAWVELLSRWANQLQAARRRRENRSGTPG
jgi:hypothetical protein